MKRLLLIAIAVLASPVLASEPQPSSPVVQKLQDTSVTVLAGDSQGSGTIFNRLDETGNVLSVVWTNAHVVDALRTTRFVIANGEIKMAVEFKDAEVVQEFDQSGRNVGEIKMAAQVIRYSDAQEGEDLALLLIRKNNLALSGKSANFYLDDNIPAIGTDLYHVGSLRGQVGSNSLTTGVISKIGRVLNLNPKGVVFDQTCVTAHPGSSGGGVYLKDDGRYIGMIARSANTGDNFNLMIPVRRMRDWAKTASVEWALDASVPLPPNSFLKGLPVEFTNVPIQNPPGFATVATNSDEFIRTNALYPFLLNHACESGSAFSPRGL